MVNTEPCLMSPPVLPNDFKTLRTKALVISNFIITKHLKTIFIFTNQLMILKKKF